MGLCVYLWARVSPAQARVVVIKGTDRTAASLQQRHMHSFRYLFIITTIDGVQCWLAACVCLRMLRAE